MAASESEIEKAVRGDGNNLLRDLRLILRPEFCSSPETQIHHDDGRTGDSGPLVPATPHADRALGASTDVRDDNPNHIVKGRPMTCDRVANAIFLRAIIANRALAYPMEMYYREALEFYEDIAGLNEPGKFHQ
jgi:hypothetical protein